MVKKKTKKNLSTHFKIWKAAGFPRDDDVVQSRYLLARKSFRKQVKYAQNKTVARTLMNIDKLRNTHPQNFWNKMKNLKKDGTTKKYTINGKQSNEDISNEFADHFNTLLNHKRIPVNVPKFEPQAETLKGEESIIVSSIELETALRSLKQNKTLDPFNLVAEHLVYAENEDIKSWLLNYYNHLFEVADVSDLLATSKMIPLAKSLKKSLKEAGNYRGISIIPILTKILEYLILQKCPEITQSHNLQFGFKSNTSTLHAEFVINETVKYYNHKKSPVYMCSLEAFDSCDWDVLFDKLLKEKKIPLRIVMLLSSLYKKGSANVLYNGHLSETFYLSQGVRQGSILSPYNLYSDLLLNSLDNCAIGTKLFGQFTGIIMYADDITMLSPTLSGLKYLLNKCTSYSNENGIAMNADKTVFLVSGLCNENEHIVMNSLNFLTVIHLLSYINQW